MSETLNSASGLIMVMTGLPGVHKKPRRRIQTQRRCHFNNADAAVKGLENLLQRALIQDLPNKRGISLVEALLKLIKRRPVAPGCGDDDEETLTFASVEDHGWRSNANWRGRRDSVSGGWSWGHSWTMMVLPLQAMCDANEDVLACEQTLKKLFVLRRGCRLA